MSVSQTPKKCAALLFIPPTLLLTVARLRSLALSAHDIRNRSRARPQMRLRRRADKARLELAVEGLLQIGYTVSLRCVQAWTSGDFFRGRCRSQARTSAAAAAQGSATIVACRFVAGVVTTPEGALILGPLTFKPRHLLNYRVIKLSRI